MKRTQFTIRKLSWDEKQEITSNLGVQTEKNTDSKLVVSVPHSLAADFSLLLGEFDYTRKEL